MHHTAAQQVSCQGRGQKEVGAGVTYRGEHEGFQSIETSMHCFQHEGNIPKEPLHLIVSTTAIDLLYIDFTRIKMIMEPNRMPKLVNILVFQDHFTKHLMAYMTPDQTTKTIAKFLYQGYILIFGAPARLLSNHGANFMRSIIGKMCKLLSMKKLQTTPYHPPNKWVGREVSSNYHVDDWEGGRR